MKGNHWLKSTGHIPSKVQQPPLPHPKIKTMKISIDKSFLSS